MISATEGKKQSGVTSVAQVKGTSEEVTFELRSEWQEGVGLCKPCRLSFTAGNLAGRDLQRNGLILKLHWEDTDRGFLIPGIFLLANHAAFNSLVLFLLI